MSCRSILVVLAVACIATVSLGQTQQVDVVIIGAGIAGLAAAYDLKTQGYQVACVEARKRVGGRIYTVPLANTVPIDLGANYLYAINDNQNPVYDLTLLQKINTRMVSWGNETIFNSTGFRQPKEARKRFDLILSEWQDLVANMRRGSMFDRPLSDVVDTFITEYNVTDEMLLGFRNRLYKYVQIPYTAAPEELNLGAFVAQKYQNMVTVLFDQGLRVVVDVLAKEVNVTTNWVARKISYGNNQVKVYSTNKQLIVAKAAIVTLPLSILKSDDIIWDPALPPLKKQAITNLAVGHLCKVVLTFEKRFWPDQVQFLSRLVPADEEGPTKYFGQFLNMHAFTDMPILIATIAGEDAGVVESMADQDISNAATDVLRLWYGDEVTNPTQVIVTRWSTDKFSNGSYSYVPKFSANTDYDALATTVDDLLYFAGEHTWSKAPGTVHGAYLSGLAASGSVKALATRPPVNITKYQNGAEVVWGTQSSHLMRNAVFAMVAVWFVQLMLRL